MALKPQGNNIVGGTSLVIARINSPGFVTGVTGWSINQDGSAEFNNVTIRGGVTIGGTSLYYSTPAPAANTLVESISSTAFTDSAGNSVLAGHVSYHYTSAGGSSIAVAVTDTGITWYAALAGTLGPWTAKHAITANALTGAGLNIDNAIVNAALTATGGTAITPSLITTDTWHAITLDAGWTAGTQAPQYRLTAAGDVQCRGTATHASVTANTNINASTPLAAPYLPGAIRFFRAADPSDSAGLVQINTSGTFQVHATAGFPATQAIFDGFYSI
jgi:hypothetical protein